MTAILKREFASYFTSPLGYVDLAVLYKYQEFTAGIFSLKKILFFLSLIVVFNFLTMRVIERRRWS